MNAAGRAIQATVCQAAGARGPGGRSIASAYAAACSGPLGLRRAALPVTPGDAKSVFDMAPF
jgi:hypothetical protein